MNADELAKIIAERIAHHETRGLVDTAAGMTDVVIHGRVNLLAVAEDILAASTECAKPVHYSWSAWFIRQARDRRKARKHQRIRQELAEQLENGPTAADAAIIRMRMRT